METNQENQENQTNQEKATGVPEEFKKIMVDFVNDILRTFPEYAPLVGKWWCADDEAKMTSLYNYCLSIYPENMIPILYQKEELFAESSTTCTDFLPGISFKYLWNDNITENTKTTLWKYLQLVLITISGSMMNEEGFKHSLDMFSQIDEREFKDKWEETLKGIESIFGQQDASSSSNPNQPNSSSSGSGTHIPSSTEMFESISGLMDGKLGQIAREIAEETASGFAADMDSVGSMEDVMKNMFQNPGKMMNLVKSVSDKLDNKMRSGEINQADLLKEATGVLQNMRDIPGLDNIQSLLEKFGGQIPGLGKNMKLDKNAMEAKLAQEQKRTAMRDRMKKNMERKQVEKALALQQQEAAQQLARQAAQPSIEEILASLESNASQSNASQSNASSNPTKEKKAKKDKKKK
jgi:hypothetical protein